jgi:hypothetical protein
MPYKRLSGWKLCRSGVEAQNARKRLHTVTCSTLPGWVARHRSVQNARSRSNSLTASLHAECKRSLPSTLDDRTRRLDLIFIAMGGAAGPRALAGCERYGKAFRRGMRNVARPANRSPSVEPRTVETVKTCAVPHPATKGKFRPGQ